MATTQESAANDRAAELDGIIDELEDINEVIRDKNLWIRTKWNSANQTPWHLHESGTPPIREHALPIEHPLAVPYVWKWRDIEPNLQKLIELCPLELTERQSVMLTNPSFGLSGVKVSSNIRIAISIYKSGDIAESHLHSPNASRTILSETGGYTIVEGERIIPKRGDLILTPNGTWHEHGNHDDEPVIWADTLDWPLMDYLGCVTVRNDWEANQPNEEVEEQFSDKYYGAGGIVPRIQTPNRGSGQKVTPMFHYTGAGIRETLDGMRGAEGSPYEGIQIEFVDPVDKRPLFPTISYKAQLLRGGEQTRPYRQTASTVYCVIDGEGYTEVEGERLEWEKNDFFVIPSHMWRHHVNASAREDAVLYTYDDEPLMAAMGQYYAQGKTERGSVVELDV